MSYVDHASLIIAVLASYLIGSIPFAYLAARIMGVDVFNIGTGNPGAANIFRTVSRPLGTAVFTMDAAKGAAGVVIARLLGIPDDLAMLGGFAAVAGHFAPVLNGFRGGAGLATAIGAGVTISAMPGLIALFAGLAGFIALRSSGPSAVVLLAALILSSIILDDGYAVVMGAAGLAAMVGIRKLLVDLISSRRKND